MSWHITDERWKCVMRGVEKSGLKFLFISAILVSPEKLWRTLNLIVIFVSFTTMSCFALLGTISIYYARNDLMTFVEIAHALSFMLALWILTSIHFFTRVPLMYQIMELLDLNIFVYKTTHGREEDEKIKAKLKKYQLLFQNFFHFLLVIAYVMLVFVAPLLMNLFGDGGRMKIEGINYKFPFPFWFPFSTETRTGFIVAYLLLSIEIFIVIFYVGVAIPFIVFTAFEIGTHFRILHNSILNVEYRAAELYSWKCKDKSDVMNGSLEGDALYEVCVRECLMENVLHHTEIVRMFKIYQDVTSTIFGVSIAISMTVLASLSLAFTKIDSFSFDAVKFAFFFITELSGVFGYCCMGTYLTEASNKIPSALYNCPWFNLWKHKQTLLIFQTCTTQSLVLKGSGLFVIDLQLFGQIARTTYSIFNVFSSKEK